MTEEIIRKGIEEDTPFIDKTKSETAGLITGFNNPKVQ